MLWFSFFAAGAWFFAAARGQILLVVAAGGQQHVSHPATGRVTKKWAKFSSCNGSLSAKSVHFIDNIRFFFVQIQHFVCKFETNIIGSRHFTQLHRALSRPLQGLVKMEAPTCPKIGLVHQNRNLGPFHTSKWFLDSIDPSLLPLFFNNCCCEHKLAGA